MKKLVCLLLTVCMLMMSVTVYASVIIENATIRLNYTKLTIDGNPSSSETLLYNDTLYIPISNAARELGFTSIWDEKTNTTNITLSGSPQQTGSPVTGGSVTKTAKIYLDYTKLTIDGNPSTSQTLLYNDTLYIPISNAARELGFTSVWDEKTNTTNITPPASSGGRAPATTTRPRPSQSSNGDMTPAEARYFMNIGMIISDAEEDMINAMRAVDNEDFAALARIYANLGDIFNGFSESKSPSAGFDQLHEYLIMLGPLHTEASVLMKLYADTGDEAYAEEALIIVDFINTILSAILKEMEALF